MPERVRHTYEGRLGEGPRQREHGLFPAASTQRARGGRTPLPASRSSVSQYSPMAQSSQISPWAQRLRQLQTPPAKRIAWWLHGECDRITPQLGCGERMKGTWFRALRELPD